MTEQCGSVISEVLVGSEHELIVRVQFKWFVLTIVHVKFKWFMRILHVSQVIMFMS